jgi:hypothetical protein
MEVQKDFKELLGLLNEYKVKYMIVGGYALAFHGAPRYTGDIDIFVKPEKNNAENVMKALNSFGFGSLDINEDDFSSPNNVVQLGVPPVRIDLITSITGVDWETAENSKVKGDFGDVAVYFIGRDDFIKNKKATGRHKDLSDIEALGIDI